MPQWSWLAESHCPCFLAWIETLSIKSLRFLVYFYWKTGGKEFKGRLKLAFQNGSMTYYPKVFNILSQGHLNLCVFNLITVTKTSRKKQLRYYSLGSKTIYVSPTLASCTYVDKPQINAIIPSRFTMISSLLLTATIVFLINLSTADPWSVWISEKTCKKLS